MAFIVRPNLWCFSVLLTEAKQAGMRAYPGISKERKVYMTQDHFRRSFTDDPTLSQRLFDLLDVVFPGCAHVAQNAREMGAAWESVSTPFVYFEGEQAISHVGVIELQLILLGQLVKVGSVHGVATHPEHRRRGYYRRLMEAVIEHCAPRYETLILTTEHPEYFSPFGFRHIPESLFRVRCDSLGRIDRIRPLNLQDPEDIKLLDRLLETRAPVSNVVGVVREKAVFCFNEGWRPLHYVADLDVTVCLELEGTKLKLFDIVGPQVPSLDALLERLPQRITEVEVYFAVDRLGVKAEAVPYLLDHDGPSHLMVRGPFAAAGQPFMLPRSART